VDQVTLLKQNIDNNFTTKIKAGTAFLDLTVAIPQRVTSYGTAASSLYY